MALNADDQRHGTVTGYRSYGCRCPACTAASTRHHKAYMIRAYAGERLLHNPTGTHRRIQALVGLGWTYAEIADRCGKATKGWVWGLLGSDLVHEKTVAAIAAAYDAMSTEVPMGPYRQRQRDRARRLGFHLPDAWLDIDDPAEEPDTGYVPYKGYGIPAEDLLSEFDWLVGGGVSKFQAARQLGVTLSAIEKARDRVRRLSMMIGELRPAKHQCTEEVHLPNCFNPWSDDTYCVCGDVRWPGQVGTWHSNHLGDGHWDTYFLHADGCPDRVVPDEYAIEADPGKLTASFPTFATYDEAHAAATGSAMYRAGIPAVRVLWRTNGVQWQHNEQLPAPGHLCGLGDAQPSLFELDGDVA